MAAKRGECYICGSDDWWWRPDSALGGPGGWLCNRCHPKPGNLEEGHRELPADSVSVGKLKVGATPVTEGP